MFVHPVQPPDEKQQVTLPVSATAVGGVAAPSSFLRWALPVLAALMALAAWAVGSVSGLLPATSIPSPPAVLECFRQELTSGRLFNDVVASMFRVAVGLTLSTLFAVPTGLVLGQPADASGAAAGDELRAPFRNRI